MKHKRADYRNWHRVEPGTGEQTRLELPGGWLVDYRAGQVLKPLHVPVCGQQRTILDTGYRWVHYAPRDRQHALTVHLDPAGVPQQLYVDICAGSGVDADGWPYTDDLYLDVIALCEVQPGGRWHVTETEIIDIHELEDAVRGGEVTPAQADLAWAEARAVQAALLAQTFGPVEVVRGYLTDPYT